MQWVRLVISMQGAHSEDAIGASSDYRLLRVLLVLFKALFHSQGIKFEALLHLALFHPLQERSLFK
jgi:hypothetical protein